MTKRMLVLDTNIISETLKIKPEGQVIAWLLQNQEDLYLNVITVGELLLGAYRLPVGKRRENLLLAIEQIIIGYNNRVLPYDGPAARCYALFQDLSQKDGWVLTVEDGMIAAICASSKAVLATRNTKGFKRLGIQLVDPFTEPTPDVTGIDLA